MTDHDNRPFAPGRSVLVQVLVDDNIEPLLEIKMPILDPPAEALAQLPPNTFAVPILITRGEATTTFCLCADCQESGRAKHALTILSHLLTMASQAALRMTDPQPDELRTSPIVKPS